MFSKFKGLFTPSAPQPVEDTVRVSDRTFHKPTAAVYGLRRGMWVYSPDHGVGILTNVYEGGVGAIMLVNEDGTNKVAVGRPLMGLRQAKLKEIPPCRRPDAEAARLFGYS